MNLAPEDFWAFIIQALRYEPGKPMVFSDLGFWVFLSVFLLVFSFSYQRIKLRNWVLLVFSFYFYYKSSGWALLLLLWTITQDFYLAQIMDKEPDKRRKKAWITASICLNLLVLGYFKYAHWSVDLLNDLFHWNIRQQNWLAHLIPESDLLPFDREHIVLPVGISFFIFHSLSYTIDVYRGIVKPLKSWKDYALFVSFFPELVAGPIVRARDFVDQIFKDYELSKHQFGKGVGLILTGLFKKIVLSDVVSTQLVDRVFDEPALASGPEAWMAVYGYGLQIFCDFSGYTDIAIGLALLLGFHLKPNFNEPYKALNISDFWRRWHISLSIWLRDYLYIPLGGNRKGKFRTYINLLITMLLGGFWHGASLKFIWWGGLHGSALAIHKFFESNFPGFMRKIPKPLAWLLTLHFVLFCWIPFRAGDMESVFLLVQKLSAPWPWESVGAIFFNYRLGLTLILVGYGLHFIPFSWKEKMLLPFQKISIPASVGLATLIIFAIYQFKLVESQPFIYFQF